MKSIYESRGACCGSPKCSSHTRPFLSRFYYSTSGRATLSSLLFSLFHYSLIFSKPWVMLTLTHKEKVNKLRHDNCSNISPHTQYHATATRTDCDRCALRPSEHRASGPVSWRPIRMIALVENGRQIVRSFKNR